MSFDALAWAARCNPGSASQKLVLLGLAENASRLEHEAWPCTQTLVEFSSLDRKTVISALDALERGGFISDTGKKAGRTKQVKVYRLAVGQMQESLPLSEPSQKRNSSEIPTKGSQKRDTEPVRNQYSQKGDKPLSSRRGETRGTRLDAAWEPDELPNEQQDEIAAFAPGWLERELSRFRDHWLAKPGAAGRKCDWNATWRNWIRKAVDDERARAGRSGGTGGGGAGRYRRSVGRELLADALAQRLAEQGADGGAQGVHR